MSGVLQGNSKLRPPSTDETTARSAKLAMFFWNIFQMKNVCGVEHVETFFVLDVLYLNGL